MELENRLDTEDELININAETPLTPLEYFSHHEDLKGEYEVFCKERNIPADDNASAEAFLLYRTEVEDCEIEL